jgi:hypothetical protein
VKLQAGRSYVVAAQMKEDPTGAGGICQTDPRITWIEARSRYATALEYPTKANDSLEGYYGGNFLIAEPESSLAIDFAPSPQPQDPPNPWLNHIITPSQPPEMQNLSRTIGWQFDVSASGAKVTGLGFYDDRKNGMGASHQVAIWNPSGELITMATVDGRDSLRSWWRMCPIAPVTLPPGAGYRIAAITASELYTWNPVGFSVGPNIRFVGDRYSMPHSTSLSYPSMSSGVTGWFGPNFEFKPIPGSTSCVRP